MTALLRPAEAAAMLRISTRTLDRLRQRGLAAYRIGGSTRYSASDIEALISDSRQVAERDKPQHRSASAQRSTVADFELIRNRQQS